MKSKDCLETRRLLDHQQISEDMMKIIAYIAAAILIFFGVLFVWGAGGSQGGGWTWVCGGALSVLFGFGLI